MNHIRKTLLYAGMAWAALACFSQTAPAQDADEPPAKGKAKPAAKAAGGGKAAATGKPVSLAPPEDPVVTALLTSNPKTPSEIFSTAQLLLEAGRPDLAKGFLKKLLDAKLDDAQWTALVDEFHTPAFTDLAGRSELRPESEELIHAALSAVNRRLHDPAQLAAEIKQLQDPSPAVRGRALSNLRASHGAGVNSLIAVLADPQRGSEHDAARGALAAMRGDAIGPLADIIDNADPELMDEAIAALAQMRAVEAIVYLFAPALSADSDVKVRHAARKAIVELMGRVPDPAQAAGQLYDLARSYFAGKQEMRTDVDGRVTLWFWDPAAKQCTARNYAPEDAARAFAARLIAAARSIAPDNRQVRLLDMAVKLERMVYDRGLDKRLDFKNPIVKEALADPRLLESVLDFCEGEHHAGGARAAAELLGRCDKPLALLRRRGGVAAGPRRAGPRSAAADRRPGVDRQPPSAGALRRRQLRAGIAGLSGRVGGRPPGTLGQPQDRHPGGMGRRAEVPQDLRRHGGQRPRGPAHGLALPRL